MKKNKLIPFIMICCAILIVACGSEKKQAKNILSQKVKVDAASSMNTALNNSLSGNCGAQVASDFNYVDRSCTDTVNSSLDACSEAGVWFLNTYPSINCSASLEASSTLIILSEGMIRGMIDAANYAF